VPGLSHDDPNRPGVGQRHRPITDLLNPEVLPAPEAPLAYHQRWEQELALDEINTHLSGREVPIRSKAPAGVVQQIYGLMVAHYVVRRVMHDAATVAMHDPDRLSFIDSLRVLQCRLPESTGLEIGPWYHTASSPQPSVMRRLPGTSPIRFQAFLEGGFRWRVDFE
jgi:hypothetical protein